MKNIEQQTDTPVINDFFNKILDIDPNQEILDTYLENSIDGILQRISFIF